MTLDLNELERLLEEATKLPWKVCEDDGDLEIRDASSLRFAICDMRYAPGQRADGKWAAERANAALIVAAVNALAALIDRVRELESEVARLNWINSEER